MKQITTILFLFLALACAGQQVDTSYTSLRWGWNPAAQDSVFFEATTTVYENGAVSVIELPRGDTLQTINHFFVRATERAREFAKVVNQVWEKGAVIDFILNANQTLSSRLDTSLVKISVEQYGVLVDSTAWEIESTLGNFTGELTVNQNGNNLKMQIGGQSYTLLPVGDAWIRFRNFPPGSFTDLHRKRFVAGGKLEFRSVDESLIIRQQ